MKKFLLVFFSILSFIFITDNVSADVTLFNDPVLFHNTFISKYSSSISSLWSDYIVISSSDKLEIFLFKKDYERNFIISYSSNGHIIYSSSNSKSETSLYYVMSSSDNIYNSSTYDPSTRYLYGNYNLIYSTFDIYDSDYNLVFPKNIEYGQLIETIQTYDYTINYYFNNVLDESKTITGSSEEGSVISYTDYSSDIYELSSLYDYNFVVTSNENIFNVYYEYKSFDYTINYYFDNVLDNEKIYNGSAIYDSIINFEDYSSDFYEFSSTNPQDFKITQNDNVFNVFYTTIMYDYTINYYFNNVLDESKTIIGQAKFNEKIDYIDYSSTLYKLDKNYIINTTINKDNNIFNIYYIDNDDIKVEVTDSLLFDISHQLLGDNIPEEFSFVYTIVEFIIGVIIVISLICPFIIVVKLIKAVL